MEVKNMQMMKKKQEEETSPLFISSSSDVRVLSSSWFLQHPAEEHRVI